MFKTRVSVALVLCRLYIYTVCNFILVVFLPSLWPYTFILQPTFYAAVLIKNVPCFLFEVTFSLCVLVSVGLLIFFCHPKFIFKLLEDANLVRKMARGFSFSTKSEVQSSYKFVVWIFVVLCWPLSISWMSNLISFRLPQNTSNREETETCCTQRRYSKQSQSVVLMLLLKTD